MSETYPLAQLGAPGDRGKRAAQRLAKVATELMTALQRVVPFLARRRIAVTVEVPRCVGAPELEMERLTTAFAVPFATRTPAAFGTLALDAGALGLLLDGVLGGNGEGEKNLDADRLTPAQAAIAGRVGGGLVRAFSEVFSARLGLALELSAAAPSGGVPSVLLAFHLGDRGRMAIVMPLTALTEEAAPPQGGDTRLADAILDVPVDVVVELGTVSIALATLERLAVGDTLLLGLSLDAPARVCAGGTPLFDGRLTASGQFVAVAIEGEQRHAA